MALLTLTGATVARADTSVLAWGNNNAGQRDVPSDATNVVAIAGGGSHSIALRANGTVRCWGLNLFGQALPPSDLTEAVAVDGGLVHSLALRADGQVVVWGNHPKPPASVVNATAIAAGATHSLALLNNGTVVSWGTETNVPADLTNVVTITAGKDFSVALRGDGTLIAWGQPDYDKTTVPAGLGTIVAIAAGDDHCLALRRDGTVTGWGANYDGQLAIPETLTNAVAIACGASHSVALRRDGTLIAWGNNDYQQCVIPQHLTMFSGVAAGGYHSLALWGNGAPAIQLNPMSLTVPVGSDPEFFAFATGDEPLGYQWLRGGQVLPGRTRANLVLTDVDEADSGLYSLRVSNPLGAATSAEATLTVLPIPPVITSQPVDAISVCGDGTASFSVSAQGRPLSYQWYFMDAEIPGATKATFTRTSVTSADAGPYFAVVSNPYGSSTSAVAYLTVTVSPPAITSPQNVSGKEGRLLTYQLTALHNPLSFEVEDLPPGLAFDPVTSVISGTNLLKGVFLTKATAFNACASSTVTITFDIAASAPAITSLLTASGTEGTPFTYQIVASNSSDTNWPTVYGAAPLPPGLGFNAQTGLISGTPVLPGVFDCTLSVSNAFGKASAVLRITIANVPVNGLSIANVLTNYSSPYLLDFQFSLRDNDDPTQGASVVVDPRQLSVLAFEDDNLVSTNATSVIIARGNTKLVKAHIVLDFSYNIADLAHGDQNNDGISDAMDRMIEGAQMLVNQLPITAQVGVFEFHREDYTPAKVVSLTTDKALVNRAIAGIWTNYVFDFPAGSRVWDAIGAAVKDLGAANPDEQHYVVVVSDGIDYSSTNTARTVGATATNATVMVYPIGFGTELMPNGLTDLISVANASAGQYYVATNVADLPAAFAKVGKDINGQYILRWATMQRSSTSFLPSFVVQYQNFWATSPPPNIWTNFDEPNIDTNETPPVTNYPVETNYIVGPYVPSNYTGDVTAGALRLVPNPAVQPAGISLRTTYSPRYVRQIRLKYRANWPCTVSLASTNDGEILYGWTLAQTNDVDGSTWLTLSSPDPGNRDTSLLFASFGSLLEFRFQDPVPTTASFAILDMDNTIYTNTGRQSWNFTTTNKNAFVQFMAALPYGTPPGWLQYYRLAGNPATTETLDTDGDGSPNWHEYRANTVPTNALSKFVVQGFAKDYNGLNLVTFQAGSNRVFRVDVSTDLINWLPAADSIIGTGTNAIVHDQNYWLDENLFYRAYVY